MKKRGKGKIFPFTASHLWMYASISWSNEKKARPERVAPLTVFIKLVSDVYVRILMWELDDFLGGQGPEQLIAAKTMVEQVRLVHVLELVGNLFGLNATLLEIIQGHGQEQAGVGLVNFSSREHLFGFGKDGHGPFAVLHRPGRPEPLPDDALTGSTQDGRRHA